jgi:hypothetical protein
VLTVNPAGPVFHLFSSGNPDFIIYMAELRVDEFGMNIPAAMFQTLKVWISYTVYFYFLCQVGVVE